MVKNSRYIDGKDMWYNSPEFDEMLRTYLQTRDESLLNKLIKAHKPLVLDIANRYKGYLKPRGILEFDDLIQEGNIGLMKCLVNHYDPNKEGRNFYSYAISWIKQGILSAIGNKNKTIRLPLHQVARFERLRTETEIYQKRYGRKPNVEELVKLTDIPFENVKELLQYSEPISLDIKYTDGDEERGARAVDNRTHEQRESREKLESVRQKLQEMIKKANLKKRDEEMYLKRHGLNGSAGCMTERELAKEYQITHQRVQQILQKTRRKIRIANGLISSKEKSAKS